MPYKITKHACAVPGCPNLTTEQYCEKHKSLKAERQKQYDKYVRSPDHNKKYGHEWKRIRARYVAEHPLCEQCLKEGRITPVEEVHHILPLNWGGTNAKSNLMSVCHSCHQKIHHQLGDRNKKG